MKKPPLYIIVALIAVAVAVLVVVIKYELFGTSEEGEIIQPGTFSVKGSASQGTIP